MVGRTHLTKHIKPPYVHVIYLVLRVLCVFE